MCYATLAICAAALQSEDAVGKDAPPNANIKSAKIATSDGTDAADAWISSGRSTVCLNVLKLNG